jgi:tripartite motif-containing protein 71
VKRQILLELFAAAWLLAACATPPSTTALPAPSAAPTEAATAAVMPTQGPMMLSGEKAPVQMKLVKTILIGDKTSDQVRGVAVDKDGNLYAVNGGTSQVLKFDPTGKLLMQWGSKGTADGQFVMSGLQGADTTGFVALDSQGNVYITENTRVQKFDSNGKFLAKWGKAGTGDGEFGLALAIAIDAQDNVYVVDINNTEIQKFDSNGKFLVRWGGPGPGPGQFNLPTSVAIDKDGNVLVAEARTGRLQKFDSNGKYLSEESLGSVDGLGMGPVALAVGDQGQLYIGEYANGRVNEFDSTGKLLASWGNTGPYKDQISEAGGLALGKDGTVYVGDAFNHRVLEYQPQ